MNNPRFLLAAVGASVVLVAYGNAKAYSGGLYFLSLRGGHLLASVFAHWAFDAWSMVAVQLAATL